MHRAWADLATRAAGVVLNPAGSVAQLGGDAAARAISGHYGHGSGVSVDTSTESIQSAATVTAFDKVHASADKAATVLDRLAASGDKAAAMGPANAGDPSRGQSIPARTSK
jgi:hypothetical protein